MNKRDIPWILIFVFAAITCICFSIVLVLIFQQVHALQITSHSGEAGLVAYNIMMNVRINGHPVRAELDTGMDFTLIPQNYASSLGLNQLSPAGTCSLTGISGSAQNCNVYAVTMQIENSHPFYTKVLLSPSQSGGMPILLSAYALYQAYHIQFVPIR